MTTRKGTTTTYHSKVGRRTQKTEGIIVQSVRLSVADNKLVHRAAKADNRSFNSWALVVLLREARKVLKPKTKVKTEKTIG